MTGAATETHVYDGDGQRVKAVVNSTTSVYVGAYYEVQGSTIKKYYYAGNVRVAERNGGVLYFLLTDHLGSTAVTTSDTGARVAELRYYPFGDTRYNSGSDTPPLPQKTTFRFTGQRWDPGSGLYFYNARWYDPLIGRFLSADTIVPQPGNPQALNRYSYVGNRPTVYVDPTGHAQVCADGDVGGGCGSAGPPASSLVCQPPPPPPTDLVWRSSIPSPDDGVFLVYNVPGYLRPRSERIDYSYTVSRPWGAVGSEQRHIRIGKSMLDWSLGQEYDERTVSGGLGPNGMIGFEANGAQTEPALTIGPIIQIQPGQVMVGWANPWGPGGARIGVEFRMGQDRFVVTSYGTLTGAGGADAFGRQYVHGDALLVSQTGFSGGGGISGFDRAVGVIRWSSVGPLMEVIP